MSSRLERSAAQLSALGHPIRLKILRYVVQGGEEGSSAGDIQAHVDMPASTLSHHLRRLVDAGLMTSRSEGTKFYADIRSARSMTITYGGAAAGNAAEMPSAQFIPGGSLLSRIGMDLILQAGHGRGGRTPVLAMVVGSGSWRGAWPAATWRWSARQRSPRSGLVALTAFVCSART